MLHHVLFWLKNPSSGQDRQELITGLKKLSDAGNLQSIQIGLPADTPDREVIDSSFDVSLMVSFHNIVDHNEYQEHAIHEKFIAECSHLWDRVKVYDIQEI